MKHHQRKKKISSGWQSFKSLQLATDRISTEIYTHLARHKLTVSQFGVLQVLHTDGPMYQISLAARIAKTTGNLTTVIDNLEKRDLVKRVREQKDRRYFKVELTPEGKKLIRKVYPAHVKRVEQVMEKLTGEEQESLRALCTKLLESGHEG